MVLIAKNTGDAPLVYTVTGSAVVSGEVVILSAHTIAVIEGDTAVGDDAVANIFGDFELPCATADVITVGERLYWDGTELTVTAAGNQFAGIAASDAAGGIVVVVCKLVGPTAPDGI